MALQTQLFSFSATRCAICHRRLTDPVSVERGIGPICSHKNALEGGRMKNKFTDNIINDPLTEGLLLWRDESGVWTNCPHMVTHHSPTGFEYGYGGSGPADLALNVVEALLHDIGYTGERMQCFDGTCFEKAFTLHQAFKWHFVASLSRDGEHKIAYADMVAWLMLKLVEEAPDGR